MGKLAGICRILLRVTSISGSGVDDDVSLNSLEVEVFQVKVSYGMHSLNIVQLCTPFVNIWNFRDKALQEHLHEDVWSPVLPVSK